MGATEECSVLNLQSQAELSTLKLDSIGLNSGTYGWFENESVLHGERYKNLSSPRLYFRSHIVYLYINDGVENYLGAYNVHPYADDTIIFISHFL